MNFNPTGSLGPWSFILIALAYFAVVRYFEVRWFKNRRVSDEEYLYRLARKRECSVFALFFEAADRWGRPRAFVEADFKQYLTEDRLPYYVRDFIRGYKKELDGYDPPNFRFIN